MEKLKKYLTLVYYGVLACIFVYVPYNVETIAYVTARKTTVRLWDFFFNAPAGTINGGRIAQSSVDFQIIVIEIAICTILFFALKTYYKQKDNH